MPALYIHYEIVKSILSITAISVHISKIPIYTLLFISNIKKNTIVPHIHWVWKQDIVATKVSSCYVCPNNMSCFLCGRIKSIIILG